MQAAAEARGRGAAPEAAESENARTSKHENGTRTKEVPEALAVRDGQPRPLPQERRG